MPAAPAPLSPDQLEQLHETLSNWGRFGERDQLGTLNLVTRAKLAAAAALVRSGRSVSCARPLPTESSIDNPHPVAHHMTGTHGEGYGGDYFALAPHGFATSHIDALCHIFHRGKLYNGYSTESVTAHGALERVYAPSGKRYCLIREIIQGVLQRAAIVRQILTLRISRNPIKINGLLHFESQDMLYHTVDRCKPRLVGNEHYGA